MLREKTIPLSRMLKDYIQAVTAVGTTATNFGKSSEFSSEYNWVFGSGSAVENEVNISMC
jgi:hypothetical protein